MTEEPPEQTPAPPEPDSPDYLVKLALDLADLDDHDRAVAYLLRAIGLNPAHAQGRLALAQLLLARGELEPGWLEYEWRNETEAGKGHLPRITSAPWNGMRIPNGRLLLIGDQGYGDTIQFARYIPLAAQRCQEVILGCSADLAPLLARVPGVAKCCQRWDEIPGHAAHARLSSLAGLFRTCLETIPAEVPYLMPDMTQVAQWAERLHQTLPPNVPRIGLAWYGRPTHPHDSRRSVSLSRLLPLAAAGAAGFVCLQKPFPEHDRAVPFTWLYDFAEDLTDFDATAALVANLDLIITVDTAVAHLAGALAKPVWLLLAKPSDWRWLLDRSDSPWYPTARLFRQAASGCWEPIIAEVATALSGWLQNNWERGRQSVGKSGNDV